MKKQKSYLLEIESRTDNLERARLFVAGIARRFRFNEEDVAKIELAVDEACTNIMKHAYKFNPARSIKILVTLENSQSEKQRLVVNIRDTGMSFNPKEYHGPDMNEYFKKYRVGGLRIMIMKKLMDEVRYNIQPGKPNEVTLVKYLS